MNTLTQTILDTVPVGALATVNRDRTPLVTPLHFVRVGDMIAWLSDREARHSHNAFRTGRAEFVVWDDAKQAVYLHTTVREAREDEVAAITEAYTAKLGASARSVPSRSGMLHQLASWMIILQQKIGCITLHKTLYIAYNRHYN